MSFDCANIVLESSRQINKNSIKTKEGKDMIGIRVNKGLCIFTVLINCIDYVYRSDMGQCSFSK
jgi:hypothetical protein